MSFGGSSPQQGPAQTTTYQPPSQVSQILKLAMPGIKKFAASVPARYPGDTVSDFTPAQQAGQEMALNTAAPAQTDLAAKGADASNFLMGDIWNPSSNPNLQNAIDAAVRPITTNYQQVVKPGIRDQFQQSGQQFGGSRRFGTEDLAGGQYLTSVGDTASKLVQDQYSNNLNAYVKALALLPQTQQAQATPASTTSSVGDVQQNQAQRELDANISGFNYDQLAPFLQSKELISLLQGIPGGSSTTTSTMPPPNPVAQGIGAASTAASFLPLLAFL